MQIPAHPPAPLTLTNKHIISCLFEESVKMTSRGVVGVMCRTSS